MIISKKTLCGRCGGAMERQTVVPIDDTSGENVYVIYSCTDGQCDKAEGLTLKVFGQLYNRDVCGIIFPESKKKIPVKYVKIGD